MNKNRIFQIAAVVLIIGVIVYIEVNKTREPAGSVQDVVVTYATSTPSGTASTSLAVPSAADTKARIAQETQQFPRAKEIVDPTGFINSPNGAASGTLSTPGSAPFTLSQFAGNKVVIVDFWTYSCINCERTIPYLNAWYQKYKNYGLEIVGVHTPEFDFEKVYSNVAGAVKQYGIQYPVVMDSNMGTWNAYQNQYWPHEYLVNTDGFIVHDHIGEGGYAETEMAIQAALKERDQILGLPDNVPTGIVSPSDVITMNADGVQSPETYFGAERNEYLANGQPAKIGTQTLTAPASSAAIQLNSLYLSGTWNFADQYAESAGSGASSTSKIFYTYNSKNMYFVAAANPSIAPNGVKINVILDGVSQGTMTIQDNKLYNLVQGSSYAQHTVEIDVEGPGLDAYTFTFG
jgi:thiol-disulfide isomerase/thioredoxin